MVRSTSDESRATWWTPRAVVAGGGARPGRGGARGRWGPGWGGGGGAAATLAQVGTPDALALGVDALGVDGHVPVSFASGQAAAGMRAVRTRIRRRVADRNIETSIHGARAHAQAPDGPAGGRARDGRLRPRLFPRRQADGSAEPAPPDPALGGDLGRCVRSSG